MVIDLEEELSNNNIDFDKVDNQYIINIDGSDLIVSMEKDVLSIYFNLKDTDRTIDIKLRINNEETYINSIDFLLIFIKYLNDSQENFEEETNDEIEKRISKTLRQFNFNNVVNIEVSGKDLTNLELTEKIPTKEDTKQELLDLEELIKSALEADNKRLYDYYQKKYIELKSQLNENTSFKFLKKFKDFFDN